MKEIRCVWKVCMAKYETDGGKKGGWESVSSVGKRHEDVGIYVLYVTFREY